MNDRTHAFGYPLRCVLEIDDREVVLFPELQLAEGDGIDAWVLPVETVAKAVDAHLDQVKLEGRFSDRLSAIEARLSSLEAK